MEIAPNGEVTIVLLLVLGMPFVEIVVDILHDVYHIDKLLLCVNVLNVSIMVAVFDESGLPSHIIKLVTVHHLVIAIVRRVCWSN